MKFFYEKSFQSFYNKAALGCVALMICSTAFGQLQTNLMDLNWWLNQKSLSWGTATNGFRTGLWWSPPPLGQIQIFIIVSRPAGLVYVEPPSGRLPKMELRDTNGVVIHAMRGKTDGELPVRITAKELPLRWHGDLHGHGPESAYHYCFVSQGEKAIPNQFKDFSIDDVYKIKQEGDYRLTVFPVVYKFETNYQFLDRIDLPTATTTIHLAPN